MTARTGPEGLKLGLRQEPDLVVLDIMLPEKDGFDLGPDDYLTKPFGVKESLAREALLEEIQGVDEDLGVTTRTVDTHVSDLRSKLGAGFAQPFIVAVHKVGYKFVEPA